MATNTGGGDYAGFQFLKRNYKYLDPLAVFLLAQPSAVSIP